MKRSEIAMLLTMAKATDDRVAVDESRVMAWEATLDQDMPFDFARQSLISHYADKQSVIMPANLNEHWRIEKRRISDLKATQAMMEHQRQIEATKADPAPYVAAIREALQANKAASNG